MNEDSVSCCSKFYLLYLFKNHSPCRACVCLSSPPFPFMCRLAFVGVVCLPLCALSPFFCLPLSSLCLICLLALAVSAAALIGGFVHLFGLYWSSILCLHCMAVFPFTLFPFVSLWPPLLAGFEAVFLSFGLCLPFVRTNLPTGTISFLCLLRVGSWDFSSHSFVASIASLLSSLSLVYLMLLALWCLCYA